MAKTEPTLPLHFDKDGLIYENRNHPIHKTFRQDIAQALGNNSPIRLKRAQRLCLAANCHDDLVQTIDRVKETIYQRSETHCLICGEESYPVHGNKKGYSQVAPEDAEEWTIDHADTCLVVQLDKILAKADEHD